MNHPPYPSFRDELVVEARKMHFARSELGNISIKVEEAAGCQ